MKTKHVTISMLLGALLGACSGGGSPGGGPMPDMAVVGQSDGGNPASMVFPPDNPWNVDVSNDPVDPNSAAYIASIGASTGLHADFSSTAGGNFGIPYVIVPASQPMVPIEFTDYPDESDPGPYPIPDNAPIEPGGDAHVIVVSFEAGMLYELYQGRRTNNMWRAANGAKFDLRSNATRPAGWTSADAAGLAIFPGLVRFDEVKAGEIKHALRFTVDTSQKGYVPPALHAAGSTTNADVPPMGLRVRLKASFDVSGFPADVQVILKAMKKYGMIVADNGSDWFISGAPHASWNDDDLQELSRVKGSDFEVVKHGPLTVYP